MAQIVYRELARPGVRLGDAIQFAKIELAEEGYRDVVTGMTLLGDPALVIRD